MISAVAMMTCFSGLASAQVVTQFSSTANREVWRGEGSGAKASFSLDRGDVSAGDSRRDLIIGSPGWSSNTGRVYVLFGGPVRGGELSLGIAQVVISGGAAGDQLGYATAAGYVTAKELPAPTPQRDLIVGAPGANGGAGAAYLFLRGLAAGSFTTTNAQLTISGAPAGAQLGASLATGDLNGDGYREIIVGAPGIGAVYVVRGGPELTGTVNLAVPSSAFFKIQGPAAGFGSSLAAGDLSGHRLTPNVVTYDLAIGAPTEAGTGAVYLLRGRSSNTFAAVINSTDLDARFAGVDATDKAGEALIIANFDRDKIGDLIIGAPGGDGAGNFRTDTGEVYVLWGNAALASRSLSTADVTIMGQGAFHRLGSRLAYGDVDRYAGDDVVMVASGAGAAGELQTLVSRARSSFAATYDMSVKQIDRRHIGDPAAGTLETAVVVDFTGDGFEDVVGGVPAFAEGLTYISFSPTVVDTSEPNDSANGSVPIGQGVVASSYIFSPEDVDWYQFTVHRTGHLRATLSVPSAVDYDLELRGTGDTVLKLSNRTGNDLDEEIITTLVPGTYFLRVSGGGGSFSQNIPYELRAAVATFTDAFEPNHTAATPVTIGPLPLKAKMFSTEDLDWYRFTTTGNGTVNISVSMPASLDIELMLGSSTGDPIAWSSSGGSGATETISLAVAGPAEYRIRLRPVVGSSVTDDYTLTVSGATVETPRLSTVLLGQGPKAGDGGWFAVRGAADNNFGATAFARLPWADYNASGGSVRMAAGDVDGDGADEVIVGLGPGSGGWVAILDDAAHGYALLSWVRVSWPAYNAANGEVFPAAGDIDGDGRAEIVLGLGNGGHGWYEVLNDASTGFASMKWNQVPWSAYAAGDGPTYPAVGDVDGDGAAEIVLGLGTGSAGWLQIANGSLSNFSHRNWIRIQWDTYSNANGTTYPAVGDLDGDGKGEIVVGLGSGGQGWFEVLNDADTGFAHVKWDQLTWPNYNNAVGIARPAIGNLDGDPAMEIVFGLGEFAGNGGWFEVRDDAGPSFASMGWFNIGWTDFKNAGGFLFPAIAARR